VKRHWQVPLLPLWRITLLSFDHCLPLHWQSTKQVLGCRKSHSFARSPIQASLLRCAAAGISIFSPHTSLDSAKNGVNDWLSGAFKNTKSVSPIEQKDNEDAGIGIGRLLVLQNAVPLKSMIPLIKEHLGLQYSEFMSFAASMHSKFYNNSSSSRGNSEKCSNYRRFA
jgi:putative NIF3 family GTP cyclohydrolase 1 type 2